MALADSEWVLVSLNGGDLVAGSNITLEFAAGRVGGFAGCNGYGSDYTAADEGKLAISMIAITLQACMTPEGIMEQESAYTEALVNGVAYRVVGDRLEIEDAGGEVTLVFVRKEELAMEPGDLVGSGWRLVSWDGDGPVEGSTITLIFRSEGRAIGWAGCRGYYATYEASGDDVRFLSLGMLGSVEPCSEDLRAQEGAYTTSLEGTTDYRLEAERLELLTAPGEVLVFEPLPGGTGADLEGTSWALVGFLEGRAVEDMATPLLMPVDVLAETEVSATFEDGTLSGSTGCNSYRGGYALDGPAIAIGPVAVTEMACLDPAGVMEQEQRYLGLLGDVVGYSVVGEQLWMETADGRALVFMPTVPPTGVPMPTATPEAVPSPEAVSPTGTPLPTPSAYLDVVQEGGELGDLWTLADVRYGLQDDRLRVVVEMAEARDHVPWFQVVEVDNVASPFPTGHDPSWGAARIDLVVSDMYAYDSPILQRLPFILDGCPVATRIGHYPTFDDARLGFSIGLIVPSAYEVHTLTDPVRIVIDVLYGP
jgi:heat shock protein HslJ